MLKTGLLKLYAELNEDFNMIALNIRELFYAYPGEQMEFQVPIPVFEDPEFTVNANQTMVLKGYKIEDGVCLTTSTQKFRGMATCTSCLNQFSLRLKPFQTERQYYTKPPEEIEDSMIGTINPKTFEVDIEEILREAVFLNLPANLRCSEECHIEHHETDLSEAESGVQPFKDLKNLIK
jgi:hypothetical protein